MGTIVPIMGATTADDKITAVLFGKVRKAILGLLFANPQKSYFLREIIRAVGAGTGAVQRELANLAQAGILNRNTSGRQVYFQANSSCPVFPELSALFLKTVGAPGLIKTALDPLVGLISFAFIYGSMARNEHGPDSDVDLLVVGNISLGQVVAACSSVQNQLAREINPSVYPMKEFVQKLTSGHHFLNSVINEPKIFLIGDEDELKRLAN